MTSARLETDHIVLGTESGFIHIINFSGQLVRSARLHKRAINSISVDLDGDLYILRFKNLCFDKRECISFYIVLSLVVLTMVRL